MSHWVKDFGQIRQIDHQTLLNKDSSGNVSKGFHARIDL